MPTQIEFIGDFLKAFIGFLLDSDDRQRRALFSRAFNDKKWKLSVSGNQTELHKYCLSDQRRKSFRFLNRSFGFQIIYQFQKIHSRIRISADRAKCQLRFRFVKNVKTPIKKLFAEANRHFVRVDIMTAPVAFDELLEMRI